MLGSLLRLAAIPIAVGLVVSGSGVANADEPSTPQPLVGSWTNGMGNQTLQWSIVGPRATNAQEQAAWGCAGVLNVGDSVTVTAAGTYHWGGRPYVANGQYSVTVKLGVPFGQPADYLETKTTTGYASTPLEATTLWTDNLTATYPAPPYNPNAHARVTISGFAMHEVGGGDPSWADVTVFICLQYPPPSTAPQPAPVPAVVAPGAPSNFTITAKSRHIALFRWNAPTTGSPVTKYTVYVRGKEPGRKWTNWGSFDGSSGYLQLQFRKKGTNVQAYVVAGNDGGTGPASTTKSKKMK